MDKWIVGKNFAIRLNDILLVRYNEGTTEIIMKEGIYKEHNALVGTSEDIEDILKQIKS